LLAESMARLRARGANPEPSARFGATAAIASMIAANLPDADLFYTGIGGDRLPYMLPHRGYTHSVVVAVLGAVLLWAFVVFLLRWRGKAWLARDDARWLAVLFL